MGIRNMMGIDHANPTAGQSRSDTLPSGFVRYEQDLTAMPATVYAGLGHARTLPRLLGAVLGQPGANTAS